MNGKTNNYQKKKFQEYSNHLHGRTHKLAMRRLVSKQKNQLSRMRMSQRTAQRDIEEKSNDTLEMRPQFCLLCRLNYRQAKVKHQLSESHRNMKKFLMPYCRICRIGFKSPMVFEVHRCSLEHIKVSFIYSFFFLNFLNLSFLFK